MSMRKRNLIENYFRLGVCDESFEKITLLLFVQMPNKVCHRSTYVYGMIYLVISMKI